MNAFFQELKRAREEKRVSLADIADRTLINIKYLEAIERGETGILPQAYVRAFIREYAAAIGLDGAEMLRRFDESRRAAEDAARPRERVPDSQAGEAPGVFDRAFEVHDPPHGDDRHHRRRRRRGVHHRVEPDVSRDPAPVTEIPFQNMVKEQEDQSAAAHPPPPPPVRHVGQPDALRPVHDTVWMTITGRQPPPAGVHLPPRGPGVVARRRTGSL